MAFETSMGNLCGSKYWKTFGETVTTKTWGLKGWLRKHQKHIPFCICTGEVLQQNVRMLAHPQGHPLNDGQQNDINVRQLRIVYTPRDKEFIGTLLGKTWDFIGTLLDFYWAGTKAGSGHQSATGPASQTISKLLTAGHPTTTPPGQPPGQQRPNKHQIKTQ